MNSNVTSVHTDLRIILKEVCEAEDTSWLSMEEKTRTQHSKSAKWAYLIETGLPSTPTSLCRSFNATSCNSSLQKLPNASVGCHSSHLFSWWFSQTILWNCYVKNAVLMLTYLSLLVTTDWNRQESDSLWWFNLANEPWKTSEFPGHDKFKAEGCLYPKDSGSRHLAGSITGSSTFHPKFHSFFFWVFCFQSC